MEVDVSLPAYALSLRSLLALELDWASLLPSFDRIGEILSDPATAFTDLLASWSNALSFANFDPSYFLAGLGSMSAFDTVLSFLRLGAVSLRRAFAYLDAARAFLFRGEAATEGAIAFFKSLVPPEVILKEAAIADVSSSCGLTPEEYKMLETKLRTAFPGLE